MMQRYEITVEVSNGDWHWERVDNCYFHNVIIEALKFATLKGGRVVSILKIQEVNHEQA